VWRAPTATKPLDATLALPGSKSITNRALLIAALADAPTTLRGALRSRDTDLMAAGLRALGPAVDDENDEWHVHPAALHGPAKVDCGLAGTVARFLVATGQLASGQVHFDGDPRLRERPMRPLLDALRQLGADIDDGGRNGFPLTVNGIGVLAGGETVLDASTSSQFVSALLLVAPRAAGAVVVRHVGPPLPSLPHIAMTVAMLRDRGAVIDDSEPDVWRIEPSVLRGGTVAVEPDLSNAAPFLAAALVAGGTVRVANWPITSTQPGAAIRELLVQMGADVSLHDGVLAVSGGGRIAGLGDVDMRECSELVPTLAVLAALAGGPTTMHGIAHMRGHETDRLAAIAHELNALGGDVSETLDGLHIVPKPLHGGVFGTYHDHRMATSGALLGLAVPDMFVENVATTAKTMPTFVPLWDALLS
jgi:3-phosphoshikimate 1-carboxyvinyltransferase